MGILLFLAITFGLLLIAWVVSVLASQKIKKRKLQRFMNHIRDLFPSVDIDRQNILFAKQNNKQLSPNILLSILDHRKEIHIIVEDKYGNLEHTCYPYDQLEGIRSSNRVISRGFWPRILSYEETLLLDFMDGRSYRWVLENLFTGLGEKQGSQVVSGIFLPWKRRLNQILAKSASSVGSP